MAWLCCVEAAELGEGGWLPDRNAHCDVGDKDASAEPHDTFDTQLRGELA